MERIRSFQGWQVRRRFGHARRFGHQERLLRFPSEKFLPRIDFAYTCRYHAYACC